MADPIPTSYAMDNGHLRHSLWLLVSNQSERSKSLYMQLVMDKGLRVLRVCGYGSHKYGCGLDYSHPQQTRTRNCGCTGLAGLIVGNTFVLLP
jgi:hypothetical protein